MDKIFEIPLLNPIHFVKVVDDPDQGIYYYRYMDDALIIDQVRPYQSAVPYSQKFTLQDTPKIQIHSDYPIITAKLYRCSDHSLVTTFTVEELDTEIEDRTFKVYEFVNVFATEGDYYTVISYQNDLLETVDYISEKLNAKEVQESTIKFEYKNSKNDFSFIFENGYEGVFRCEADLIEFKPASTNTVYNDQVHSPTLVAATPYRMWTLFIGGTTLEATAWGVPDYVADLVNRIMCCNQVKLDGKYYCRTEGAEWEEVRPDNYQFSAQRLSISESENKFTYQFDTSFLNDTEMAYIFRSKNFLNNTENPVIEGLFKNRTYIDKVLIRNLTETPFTVTVETATTGGNDDFSEGPRSSTGEYTVIELGKFFGSDKTINIIGLDEITTDVYVTWLKLDAVVGGTPNPYTSLGVGAVVIYEEQSPGDFQNDFDVLTGLGLEDSDWFGWALCDGRHGTKDRRDRLPLGINGLDITKESGALVGSNQITIGIGNLPEHNHKLFGDSYNRPPVPGNPTNLEPYSRPIDGEAIIGTMIGPNGFDQYRLGESTASDATIGKTSGVGADAPIDYLPESIYSVFVKKIS